MSKKKTPPGIEKGLAAQAHVEISEEWILAGNAMNLLYDSAHFYMVEFPGRDGIELVDKTARRGGFLEGDVAAQLRASMQHLFSDSPTVESVDEFLEHYDALLTNPVVLH